MTGRADTSDDATAIGWVARLSPWPEEFGLDRMSRLLADLGDPQRAYPSIHVVGTNGKSTATRTIEELLRPEGLRVGAYLSPHVSGWSERIRVAGEEADLERALARVRPHAAGATQFEVLTAAALAEFAAKDVDVAVVEAGLGGRHDATNVVDAPVVLLTNVALEHTEVLGDTREAIAREKLAVARPGATVVLPDAEWSGLVPDARVVLGGAREAAEAFLGHATAHEVEVALPGRLERRGDDVWDGAHTPDAVDWLLARLPRTDYILCVSVLADKDVDGMLVRLATAGRTLVATRSGNPRALPAEDLARRARAYFEHAEHEPDPLAALERAHDLAGAEGAVLVTGSLYLLADLFHRQPERVE
jgi:dihydrofolate synthase/folylpolyglutamate synthase